METDTMGREYSFKIMNNISEIARMCSVVEEFGHLNCVPITVVNNISLALDEIITNIISYGYPDGSEHVITVNLVKEADSVTAVIEDDAVKFNPLEVPEPDTTLNIEDRAIGGLGIHLVKKLMDSVDYKFIMNKNILTIKKLF